MRLRRRRYRGYHPVAYPAWRLWEDRRVRTDEGVFGLFFAVRIARIDLDDRKTKTPGTPLVSNLYTNDELPFREGFKVTTNDASERWDQGELELCRLGVLAGVASLDELLGATIDLSRVMGIDHTATGTVQTGVSDKLAHLIEHGGLDVGRTTVDLYNVCIAIRNSVAHHGSRQRPVANAWLRLSDTERQWWEAAAGRPLQLTSSTDELILDDRELITVMRVLDRVALEVNSQLLDALADHQWAWLVARELWLVNPSQAGDATRNVGAVQRRARRLWRLDITPSAAKRALADRDLRSDSSGAALLRTPLER